MSHERWGWETHSFFFPTASSLLLVTLFCNERGTFSMKLQIRPPRSRFFVKTLKLSIWLASLSFYIRHLLNGFPRFMTTIMTDNGYLVLQVTFKMYLPFGFLPLSTNSPDKFHFFFATLSLYFSSAIWQVFLIRKTGKVVL